MSSRTAMSLGADEFARLAAGGEDTAAAGFWGAFDAPLDNSAGLFETTA